MVLTFFARPRVDSITSRLNRWTSEAEISEDLKVDNESGSLWLFANGDGAMGCKRSNSFSFCSLEGIEVDSDSTLAFSGKALKNLFFIGSQSMPCGTGKGGGAITAASPKRKNVVCMYYTICQD